MAYENDPRILGMRAAENNARNAVKQAKKDIVQLKYKVIEDKKLEDERIKKEAEDDAKKIKLNEANIKKERAKQYRACYKEFYIFCEEKMPGTKYDRYFLEEFAKRYAKLEDLLALFEVVKFLNNETFL